ncbi:MAG: DMT family transporter [Oscillospiraceae bacterium]|nr:DMT family transporter [Oscillospiraceae bacterium]
MFQLLALLTGAVIALSVASNGSLTAHSGLYTATVILHAVGTLVALIAVKAQRKSLRPTQKLPIWMYTGGLIGVFTAIFNNLAFGQISMTAIVALGLFGQTVCALFIDGFGLFGTQKRPIRGATWLGLAFSLAGIVYMLVGSGGMTLLALLVSLGSGVTIIVSRMINALLAEKSSAITSSFINHFAGLLLAIVVFLLLGRGESFAGLKGAPWAAYFGGALGVLLVLLNNLTVLKISAFQVTLLTFVGQLFVGIAIDFLLQNGYSKQTFIGGILVSVGIAASMLAEKFIPAKS